MDALVECATCGFRELARLTLDQVHELSAHESIERHCPLCRVIRAWKFGPAEAGMQTANAPADGSAAHAAKQTGAENPRARRITVKLPVRVRLSGGEEEVTRTENLSKTGLCFISQLDMQPEDSIKVTVGYQPGVTVAEVPARIVWRKPVEGAGHFVYGVHIEGSEQKPGLTVPA